MGRDSRELRLMFFTRIVRMFSYGMLPVIFVSSLLEKGLESGDLGWIQSGVVFGDIFISLWLTSRADRYGRRNTLMFGALLKLVTGLIYAYSHNLIVLLISGIVGVISVSGGEIGPFMPIEQSVLSQLIQNGAEEGTVIAQRTAQVFAYYNMAGYLASACGNMFAGFYLVNAQWVLNQSQQDASRQILVMFGLFGLVKFGSYWLIRSSEIESEGPATSTNVMGIKRQNILTIVTLSMLFAVDAFAGGLVVQSFISFYYDRKYGLNFDQIGVLLFCCNIVSGLSGVLSAKLVRIFGAMATMIYTHLPSNVLLIAIGLVSDRPLSIGLLIARFCISQMDVPARQTYVTLVVSSEERSAANGITNIARSVGLTGGLALSHLFIGMDPQNSFFGHPFLYAGTLKIIYDITIGCCFLWNRAKKEKERPEAPKQQQLHEEQPQSQVYEDLERETTQQS